MAGAAATSRTGRAAPRRRRGALARKAGQGSPAARGARGHAGGASVERSVFGPLPSRQDRNGDGSYGYEGQQRFLSIFSRTRCRRRRGRCPFETNVACPTAAAVGLGQHLLLDIVPIFSVPITDVPTLTRTLAVSGSVRARPWPSPGRRRLARRKWGRKQRGRCPTANVVQNRQRPLLDRRRLSHTDNVRGDAGSESR